VGGVRCYAHSVVVGLFALPAASALYRVLALTIAALAATSGSMGILGYWDTPKIELARTRTVVAVVAVLELE
jgi:hypothetical protein